LQPQIASTYITVRRVYLTPAMPATPPSYAKGNATVVAGVYSKTARGEWVWYVCENKCTTGTTVA